MIGQQHRENAFELKDLLVYWRLHNVSKLATTASVHVAFNSLPTRQIHCGGNPQA
jgi:hypothetical protein